tara:strand:+ start:1507 stop:1701 length:195 start_codon:yes stop_codon:yes gene_type:complete
MKRFVNTERIEFAKLLKECDRLDLMNSCLAHWYENEDLVEPSLITKEELVEKLIQDFPEKKVRK